MRNIRNNLNFSQIVKESNIRTDIKGVKTAGTSLKVFWKIDHPLNFSITVKTWYVFSKVTPFLQKL